MKEGHIWIDGIITEDYHLQVKKQIEANADADVIVLHIQSPGGSVYAGYNTFHALKSSGKRIKSIIEGEAQSMATFISLAGNEIEIRNPSVYMIHNPSSGIEGDADMMISGASELRNIENDMAEAYATRTKLPIEKIKEMMKNTTVLNARQAKELGFADRVIDPLRAVAIGKPINMENKLNDVFASFKAKMEAVINDVFPEAVEAPVEPMKEEEKPVEPAKAMVMPAGEYQMADGSIIVVDEMGVIVEVKPSAPVEPMETAEQKMIKALQAEIETIKATAAASEQKATSAAQALGTIKSEFEAMRKMTVGDNSAPKAAATFTKTPATQVDDNDSAMRDEIFAHAGLNWIKDLKQKNN